MTVRKDANRLALHTARSIVDAAADLRLEVEGTTIDIKVERLPPLPFPTLSAEGQEVLEGSTDGPWPGAVQVECSWKEGSRTLLVQADYSRPANEYRHHVALRVSPVERTRDLIWMNLCSQFLDAEDDEERAFFANASIYKRKEYVEQGDHAALKAVVNWFKVSVVPQHVDANHDLYRDMYYNHHQLTEGDVARADRGTASWNAHGYYLEGFMGDGGKAGLVVSIKRLS